MVRPMATPKGKARARKASGTPRNGAASSSSRPSSARPSSPSQSRPPSSRRSAEAVRGDGGAGARHLPRAAGRPRAHARRAADRTGRADAVPARHLRRARPPAHAGHGQDAAVPRPDHRRARKDRAAGSTGRRTAITVSRRSRSSTPRASSRCSCRSARSPTRSSRSTSRRPTTCARRRSACAACTSTSPPCPTPRRRRTLRARVRGAGARDAGLRLRGARASLGRRVPLDPAQGRQVAPGAPRRRDGRPARARRRCCSTSTRPCTGVVDGLKERGLNEPLPAQLRRLARQPAALHQGRAAAPRRAPAVDGEARARHERSTRSSRATSRARAARPKPRNDGKDRARAPRRHLRPRRHAHRAAARLRRHARRDRPAARAHPRAARARDAADARARRGDPAPPRARGHRRATLADGCAELLAHLAARGIPMAILTRNVREVVETFARTFGFPFAGVYTREDGPHKPAPDGVLALCAELGAAPAETLVVGDYKFDILAGRARAAGPCSCSPSPSPLEELADWGAARSGRRVAARAPAALFAGALTAQVAAGAAIDASSLGSAFANWPLAMTSLHPLARAASIRSVRLVIDEADARYGTRRRRRGRSSAASAAGSAQIDDDQLRLARRRRERLRIACRPGSSRPCLGRLAHLRREQHVRDEVDDVGHGRSSLAFAARTR